MGSKIVFAATAAAALIALSACSTAPTTPAPASEAKKEEAKAPEAVVARTAYFEMYKPARAWATDLMALTLTSGEVKGVKNSEGKAGLWKAVFVSPSLKEARTFTWAADNSGDDIRKGIDVGDKQNWGGATPAAKAFVNAEFHVDSDAAYKVAVVAAAGRLKTHPGGTPTFLLGNSARFPGPVWYIMFGTPKDGFAAYVNATTGDLITR